MKQDLNWHTSTIVFSKNCTRLIKIVEMFDYRCTYSFYRGLLKWLPKTWCRAQAAFPPQLKFLQLLPPQQRPWAMWLPLTLLILQAVLLSTLVMGRLLIIRRFFFKQLRPKELLAHSCGLRSWSRVIKLVVTKCGFLFGCNYGWLYFARFHFRFISIYAITPTQLNSGGLCGFCL